MKRLLASQGRVLALAAVVLAACSDTPTTPSLGTGQLSLLLTGGSGNGVVVIEIRGPGIEGPLVHNLDMEDGVAEGDITVPAGSDREITLRAFDASGIETHRGTVVVDVQPGPNAAVTVLLVPLQGQQPITGTIGSFTITVSPDAPVLSVWDAVVLHAEVRDASGTAYTGAPDVLWGSTHPAAVRAALATGRTGFAWARAAGTAQVVGVFGGVAAAASVEVRYAPTGAEAAEPNGGFVTATDGSVLRLRGSLESPDDIDLYRVLLIEGAVVHARVHAAVMGSPLDPVVRAYDAAGAVLGSNEDGGDGRFGDSFLSLTIPATADYYFGVEGSGGSEGDYAFTLSGPRPAPGQIETEPNDGAGEANPLSLATIVEGVIVEGELDQFAFTAEAGVIYAVDLDAAVYVSPLDSRIEVYAPDGSLVASNDDGAAPGEPATSDSYLAFTAGTAGAYRIAVGRAGTTAGLYQLTVTD